MVYDHAVIAYGKYYPAGAELLEENQIVNIPTDDISVEDIPSEVLEEKPKRTRKTVQEKTEC
jgi:hypothetical protein